MNSVFTFLFSVYGLIKTENKPGDLACSSSSFYVLKRYIKTTDYTGTGRNRPTSFFRVFLGAK
jgi:hypothetical protein